MKKVKISILPLMCLAVPVYSAAPFDNSCPLFTPTTIPETAELIVKFQHELIMNALLTNYGTITVERNGVLRDGVLRIGSGGELHNFGHMSGKIKLDAGAKITTSAKASAVDDTPRATNDYTPSSGGEYNATLLTSTQLKGAAYYDLANDAAKVTNFKRLKKPEYEIEGPGGIQQLASSDFLKVSSGLNTDRTAYFIESGYTLGLDVPETASEEEETLKASLFSVEGYVGVDGGDPIAPLGAPGSGITPPVDPNVRVIKTGAGTLKVTSDNSWYNGVFDIQKGTVDVQSTGAMFGGDINLLKGETPEQKTELIWHGGPKDPYNKPTITLFENSKLTFDLSGNAADDKIFSVYGVIRTEGYDLATPTEWGDKALVHIDSGKIYIKGDCSGFHGKVIIDPGAILMIRQDDDHVGKMFGGTLDVKEGGTIAIKTNYGLAPLTLTLGTVVIQNDGGAAGSLVDRLSIGKDAAVIANFRDALFESTKVQGTMTVGENATFNNLVVDGGTVKLDANVAKVTFEGITKFGSTLNTIDGLMSRLYIHDLRITDDGDHNMKWHLDFDPLSETTDCIVADRVSVLHITHDVHGTLAPGGPAIDANGALVIERFQLNSLPDDQDAYIFQVLEIADGNYPEMRVSSNQEFQGPLGTYRLYAYDNRYAVLKTPDAQPMINTKWNIKQIQEINSVYLPTRLMHHAALSTLADVHSAVYDTTIENSLNRDVDKYGTWGKFLTSNYDVGTTQGRDIRNENNSMVLGCDMAPILAGNNLTLIPTVWAAYSKGNLKYAGRKGQSDYGLVGTKLTSLVGDSCLFELVGSYGLVSTDGRSRNHSCDMESHAFSIGAKASYRVNLSETVELIPTLQTDYACVITQDSQMKNTRLTHRGLHNMRVSPDLGLSIGNGVIKATLNAKFNARFGGDMLSSIDGELLPSTTSKMLKRNFEYKAGLSGKAGKAGNIVLEVGKAVAGKKGLSAKVAYSLKM